LLKLGYRTVLGWALRLVGLNAEEGANVASRNISFTLMSSYLSSSDKWPTLIYPLHYFPRFAR